MNSFEDITGRTQRLIKEIEDKQREFRILDMINQEYDNISASVLNLKRLGVIVTVDLPDLSDFTKSEDAKND